MSYTQEQLEKALALHTRLVRSGLDPDYAELRVVRALDRMESTPVEQLATDIEDSTDERWKAGQSDSRGSGNFFDELRRRIEAERAEQRNRGSSAKERLGAMTRGGR